MKIDGRTISEIERTLKAALRRNHTMFWDDIRKLVHFDHFVQIPIDEVNWMEIRGILQLMMIGNQITIVENPDREEYKLVSG